MRRGDVCVGGGGLSSQVRQCGDSPSSDSAGVSRGEVAPQAEKPRLKPAGQTEVTAVPLHTPGWWNGLESNRQSF